MERQWTHPETIVLHTGYRSDAAVHAVSVPIYQTTAYEFESTEHAENVFSLKLDGNTYTRIINPTVDVLEQRVAALEGGTAGLAVTSGQSATLLSILNICQAGQNVVSSTDLYGGSWNLLGDTMRKMGIETRFADSADPENFRRLTDENTRCYYAETLPNPKLQVFPIRQVAAIAQEFGLPLIMDNTVAPLLCRPFEHGAAIVIYSATKYIGGHGNSLGGMIVDGGRFDWAASGKFPVMTDPDPSYSNVVWPEAVQGLTSALGRSPYLLKARMTLLRDIGAALSPFNAFLLLQGLETMPLRMKAHCANAAATASWLVSHPKVEKVIYPGLAEGEARRRADVHLKGGYGPMVQIHVKGGREAGRSLIEGLKLFYHVANIGDSRSLAIHPASTTHARLSEPDQIAAGVHPGSVRLSIGIEHIDDILADLEQALAGI
ncbi:MAG TPA: O-acetylhomoserine aminocarboxypropyltransferase/cysteine synthase family protein [Thermoanaerobaculia bacterium]|nr:O-acetylhomoserine aminocarboxypropyltransferase/cysteine synthase family protein [Thermoanaerobaculia bacterium]